MLKEIIQFGHRYKLFFDYNSSYHNAVVIGDARNLGNEKVYVLRLDDAAEKPLISVAERYPNYEPEMPYPVNIVRLPLDTWGETITLAETESVGPGTIDEDLGLA